MKPEYVSRMWVVNPKTGRPTKQNLLVFSWEMSRGFLGTLILSRGRWCFMASMAFPPALDASDLQQLLARLKQRDGEDAETREKARKKTS